MSKELTPKQKKAAVMLGCGNSCASIAKDIGIAVTTLAAWRKKAEFRIVVNATLNDVLAEAACEALRELKNELKDKNVYVRQNAARDILTRYETAEKENNDGIVEIRFVGMPELGMPETSDPIQP